MQDSILPCSVVGGYTAVSVSADESVWKPAEGSTYNPSSDPLRRPFRPAAAGGPSKVRHLVPPRPVVPDPISSCAGVLAAGEEVRRRRRQLRVTTERVKGGGAVSPSIQSDLI